MRAIAIYIEGGGESAQQRAEFRRGMDRLLGRQKEAARAKGVGLRLVPSGSRNEACRAFRNAVRNGDDTTLFVLLVDSEDPIRDEEQAPETAPPEEKEIVESSNAKARRDHLIHRDHWDLEDIPAERIHLMVTCMETWIAADPEALDRYYGQGFRRNLLPRRRQLEEEPKAEIYKKLASATRMTSKGSYSDKYNSKIKHGAKLLGGIDPSAVATRCPRYKTLTTWLDRQIDGSQETG